MIRLAASHPDWVLGYADEVWRSRPAQPNLHAWTAGWDGPPLRLVQRTATGTATGTTADPEALACYGLFRRDTDEVMLRFVAGRPVSHVATQFLAGVCGDLAAEGKRALLLVWDNAAWHVSREVRAWVKAHNRQAQADGGVRVVVGQLPVKSLWLNPIEPKWVHGKRAVAEPDGALAATESTHRICDYYGCPWLPVVPPAKCGGCPDGVWSG